MQRRTRGQEEGWLLSYADLITNLLVFFVMLLSASSLSRVKMQQIAKSISGAEASQSLESIQREIDSRITKAGMQNLVRTKLTGDGLELSLNSGIVFDSGSDILHPQWEGVVGQLLGTLTPYSKKYAFAVEGHTDVNPIVRGTSRFPSNWELSSARAITLRMRLEAAGIPRERIRVEAYADTKPLPESETVNLSSDEKLARHRRVIVRIY
jgi:chemotaxis protein MotB